MKKIGLFIFGLLVLFFWFSHAETGIEKMNKWNLINQSNNAWYTEDTNNIKPEEERQAWFILIGSILWLLIFIWGIRYREAKRINEEKPSISLWFIKVLGLIIGTLYLFFLLHSLPVVWGPIGWDFIFFSCILIFVIYYSIKLKNKTIINEEKWTKIKEYIGIILSMILSIWILVGVLAIWDTTINIVIAIIFGSSIIVALVSKYINKGKVESLKKQAEIREAEKSEYLEKIWKEETEEDCRKEIELCNKFINQTRKTKLSNNENSTIIKEIITNKNQIFAKRQIFKCINLLEKGALLVQKGEIKHALKLYYKALPIIEKQKWLSEELTNQYNLIKEIILALEKAH